jgi:hypothetical protein
MDRTIKITISIFIAVLVATVVFALYSGYVTSAYQSTRTGTYSYSLSISTDSPLTNITLFVPVPADLKGNSPAVSQLSAGQMQGIPGSWQTTLFDTGKTTLVKIHIPSIVPPAGTSPDHPFTVTITSDQPVENTIDTVDPVASSPVFRPLQNLRQTACSGFGAGNGGNPECSEFSTALYADYTADPNAVVTITSSITGKNSWAVFGQKTNEYTSVISLLLHGPNHGWATARGSLAQRIGSFDDPFRIP